MAFQKLTSIHKDVTERLILVNHNLANDVRIILEENKAERHIRGGQATKTKYRQEDKKGDKNR